jgi:hypothetical protein
MELQPILKNFVPVFGTMVNNDGTITVLYFGKPIGWINSISYERSCDRVWRAVNLQGQITFHCAFDDAVESIKISNY